MGRHFDRDVRIYAVNERRFVREERNRETDWLTAVFRGVSICLDRWKCMVMLTIDITVVLTNNVANSLP